ncbi:MAG: hypothetical protein CMF39_03775 [Legionellaceae bacterium]|nr:hypothetical protein [Legionellaceae bacterium]
MEGHVMPNPLLASLSSSLDALAGELPRSKADNVCGYLRKELGDELIKISTVFNSWIVDESSGGGATLKGSEREKLIKLEKNLFDNLPYRDNRNIYGHLTLKASRLFFCFKKVIDNFFQAFNETEQPSGASADDQPELSKFGSLLTYGYFKPPKTAHDVAALIFDIIAHIAERQEPEGQQIALLKSLQYDREVFLCFDHRGLLPLSAAVVSRQESVANFLLKNAQAAGINIVDMLNEDKTTALYQAVRFGFLEIVSMLVDNFSAKADIPGSLPLEQALNDAPDESVQRIIAYFKTKGIVLQPPESEALDSICNGISSLSF